MHYLRPLRTLVSVGFLTAAACTPAGQNEPEPPASSGGAGGGKATGGTSGSGGTTSSGAGGTTPASGGSVAPATGGSTAPATGGTSGGSDAAPPTPATDGGSSGSPDPQQPSAPAPTDLAKHKYSKEVRMDTSAGGANVAAAVAKYPVAVALNAMNFDFSQAKDNGDDIRFSKADGSLLHYNVESWDKAGQSALVWVLVDEVKGNDATQSFLMHWGNPDAGSASNPKAVFSMENGFMGVWHLNEDGNTTVGGYKDSSSYEAHGTGVNMEPGTRVDGRLGKGTKLNNSKAAWKGQWVRVDGPKVENMYNANDKSITVSIWAKALSFPGHSTIGGYETVFSKGDTSWTFQRFSFNRTWEACTKGPGNVTWHNCAISKSQIATDKWFHFMVVITPARLQLYINGVSEAGTGNGKRISPHPFGIGQQTQVLAGKREWDGILDEARVMNVERNANWAKLDYEAQKEGSTFLKFGETKTK